MVGTDFFAKLPKFPTTDKLIQLVVNRFGSYKILSSPLRYDHENSKKHKIDWIGRKLKIKPTETIIVANKTGYAKQPDGTPNILIDDRGLNVENWVKSGGYGIKYQADEDSLEKVVAGLDDYKQKHLEERGPLSISGLSYGGFRRPLKIKKSTKGKLRYDKPKGKKIKMGADGNLSYKKFVRKVYEVTADELKQIETYADRLFAKVGIDVRFTKHFLDRVNDTRNEKEITPAELTRLFKQEFKKWGRPIAQMGPDAEAVMKDMRTDVNVPFALVWDKNNNELDLVAKTVMKKQDFKTSNREFTIENEEIDSTAFNEIITPALERLDKAFKKDNFEIRIVGGAVRDIALGKTPKDIDLATDATPDEMIELFDKNNIRHKPTGLEHGTVTAIIDSEPFEITTLRADVSTDGRHADVEFIRNWKEDAQRRDLTYNAMSLDFDGNLYDYFNGMDDLQDKVSNFVGDPEERIKEDYLRILRYFRFQSKLDSPKWDKDTLVAIKDNAKGLPQISVERIWQEMGKLLVGNSVIQSLAYMSATNVDRAIGLDTSNIQKLKDLKGNTDPIMALALLVDSLAIANQWKLSNAEEQDLKFYLSYRDKKLNKEQAEHLVIDGTDKLKVSNLLKLQKQDKLASYIEQFQMPEFPITGNDLIQRGMKPGPDLGNTLNKLKDLWKKSNYDLSADELLGAVSFESTEEAKRMNDMLGITEGVGIITAYNTTKDVKPGETARQANKLGLQVKGEGKVAFLRRSWENEKQIK
jgi:tRNA nucleotidyltransferase (CCA-adding enzyme)